MLYWNRTDKARKEQTQTRREEGSIKNEEHRNTSGIGANIAGSAMRYRTKISYLIQGLGSAQHIDGSIDYSGAQRWAQSSRGTGDEYIINIRELTRTHETNKLRAAFWGQARALE